MNDNDNNLSNISFVQDADEDRELAHLTALAGDEAYWNYLDEVDLHLEVLEMDCPSEAF